MFAIETKALTKKYKGVTAVDCLDLKVREGEILALLGVNAAGKTTTVNMLSGVLSPTSGDALLFGKSILNDTADIKKLISLSPQETAIAPNLTVKENLELICGMYGFSKDRRKEKICEISQVFKLTEIMRKRAGKLSGGYKRRLSIAMALISEPKILFLDEPTLGIDVIARSELWDILRKLKGRITIILTTHYMEEAETLSDRVAIMCKGKLVTIGTTEEIKAYAGADRFADAFVTIVKEGKQ